MLTNNWLVGKKTTKLLHTNILEYQSSTHIYSMFYELEGEIYRKSKYIKNHLLWNQCSPYDHYFNVLNYQHFNFIDIIYPKYFRNIFLNMIQNKTIHYWKLGRDELLLARRNPEIKKSRRRGVDMVQLYVLQYSSIKKNSNNNKYILFLLY